MTAMTRRADNLTDKNCPKLKGKDKLLPKGTKELSPFQQKLILKEFKRLMEIHGKKEQDKYWADYRGTAGRLTSEHAGNLWT